MAKELSKSGISTGQDILAGHVTQSVDALTGTEAYDITVSGSLTITGSTFIQPTNVSTGTNVLTVDSNGKIYKTGSYSAGGGGTTPTWQQVTDQGASTTNDLTITGNITASDLIITSSNFAVIARGAGDDIIQLAAGSDSDIYMKGDDYIRLNNNQIRITGSITASANISASGIVYAETGSFSHLQGNSPITVGDSTTFQQSITASGDISSSGFLFITASELDPASQILTFNTESGAVHYANFHISTSTSTNTIGDNSTDLDFKGPNVSVIAQDDHKVIAKKSLYKNPTLQTVHSADYENEIFKWGQNSVTISASAGHISASGTASAAYLEIRGIGGGASSGFIADSAGAGDMKFGIGTDSPTETLDVAGGIKASMDLTARNATFSGSLVVSGSSSILMTSGSSTQTFGVGGYYKTRWGQADADFTFFSDDYINLLWNEAGSDDIEGQIKTNPSSGEVHIITNNDGAYTYLDRQVSDGVFDIDSNLGNDENLEFTIGSPMDNSYPFYRVTIRSANTAGAGAGVTCLIEKFT